jgi:hypothetical protein
LVLYCLIRATLNPSVVFSCSNSGHELKLWYE